MRLERAIAAYLTERIPGLHAFKDEIAFVAAGNPYPYFLIDRIATRRTSLGTGLWDKTIDADGKALQVKSVKVHQTLRFTVRAAVAQGKSGNEVVAEIADRLEELLGELCREGSVDLPDPAGGAPLRIERALFQGRWDLPTIEKGMPFVSQVALSFLFIENRLITRPVASRINKINISLKE